MGGICTATTSVRVSGMPRPYGCEQGTSLVREHLWGRGTVRIITPTGILCFLPASAAEHVPPGPAQENLPEDHPRWWSGGISTLAEPGPGANDAASTPSPSWDEMQRMEFEVSMLLRGQISDAASLEHAQHETHSLLHAVAALHTAAALSKANMATIIQSCVGSGDGDSTNLAVDQKEAALSLGITRLRKHLRIKIADAEDLDCAHKALLEMAAFFRGLAARAPIKNSGTSGSYHLLVCLRNGSPV